MAKRNFLGCDWNLSYILIDIDNSIFSGKMLSDTGAIKISFL